MKNFLTMAVIAFCATGVSAQQKELSLLIGTYTGTGSKGIYHYSFNTATATARETGTTGNITNPSFLAVSPDKKFVYAVAETEGRAGNAAAYKVEGGTLKQLNVQSSKGEAPCHVSVHPSGKWVSVANYSGGNFSVFKVNTDGS
ncbi:MAG: beta-propeller fold lactonase family protein, partial [Mucilaginibacter polytrichastri]|nr:beta-propeller fold lactonase family protein [Mucilaginibacter polytrichastri]